MLGREVLEYDPAHLLVFAVDLPISSQVTRASRKDPYLGFVLELDPTRVAELAARVYPRGIPERLTSAGCMPDARTTPSSTRSRVCSN